MWEVRERHELQLEQLGSQLGATQVRAWVGGWVYKIQDFSFLALSAGGGGGKGRLRCVRVWGGAGGGARRVRSLNPRPSP